MKPYKPEIPEELKRVSISFKTAFWIAFAVHAFIGVAFATTPLINAKVKEQKKQIEEDRKALEEPVHVYVGVPEDEKVAIPPPAPTPPPPPDTKVHVVTKTETKTNDWPQPKLQPQAVKKVTKLTAEYTVMPGDTFYSIVRKYKLDPVKLQRLNKITDINKLTAGQKLKLL